MAKREHKTPKPRYHIGDVTGIQDKNGRYLCVGDKVRYGEYTGRFLLNYNNYFVLAIDYSKWYGDNVLDLDSYGKAIFIPDDNGGKMNLEIIEPIIDE